MPRTERLVLSALSCDDCEFILRLVNEPSFRRFIGDKGVRTIDDARNYLRDGPVANHERYGYGMYLVSLATDGTPLGMCGLVKRDQFDDPDLGYAFLRQYWSKGYAMEAAITALEHGRKVSGLKRFIALVDQENSRSVRLLQKLGFTFERMVCMAGETGEVSLWGLDS